jgi:GNAT superfamily N-acetyltransferase
MDDPALLLYLEDFFVASDLRGRGIGRVLIEDLLQLCRQQVWSRLYWHTRGSKRGGFMIDMQ